MKTRTEIIKEIDKRVFFKWWFIHIVSFILGSALFIGGIYLIGMFLMSVPTWVPVCILVFTFIAISSMGPAIDMAEKELKSNNGDQK